MSETWLKQCCHQDPHIGFQCLTWVLQVKSCLQECEVLVTVLVGSSVHSNYFYPVGSTRSSQTKNMDSKDLWTCCCNTIKLVWHAHVGNHDNWNAAAIRLLQEWTGLLNFENGSDPAFNKTMLCETLLCIFNFLCFSASASSGRKINWKRQI